MTVWGFASLLVLLVFLLTARRAFFCLPPALKKTLLLYDLSLSLPHLLPILLSSLSGRLLSGCFRDSFCLVRLAAVVAPRLPLNLDAFSKIAGKAKTDIIPKIDPISLQP